MARGREMGSGDTRVRRRPRKRAQPASRGPQGLAGPRQARGGGRPRRSRAQANRDLRTKLGSNARPTTRSPGLKRYATKSNPFGLPKVGSQPLSRQRQEEKRRGQRAANKLPDHPEVGRIRGTRSRAQQLDILQRLLRPHAEDVLREGRPTGPTTRLLRELNSKDRKTVRDLQKSERARRENLESARTIIEASPGFGGRPWWRDPENVASASPIRKGNRLRDDKTNIAGISLPTGAAVAAVRDKAFSGGHGAAGQRFATGVKDAARLAPTAVWNIGRATVEEPGKVAKTSMRVTKEMITGLPQAAKMLASDIADHPTDPTKWKTTKATLEDYARRYGTLLDDPKAFRKMVQEEDGVPSFVLDAVTVAVPIGHGAGALAASSGAGRVVRALEASRPGARTTRAAGFVRRAATEQRPDIRFSGGRGGTAKQQTSGNLIKGVTQHATDVMRTRKLDRELENKGWRRGDGGKLEPIEGREQRRVGAIEESTRRGEVPAYFSPREMSGVRRFTGRRQRAIGDAKGRGRLWMLTHRGRVLKEVDDRMARLSEDEMRGLHVAVQLGVPAASVNPTTVRRVLDERIAEIEAARAGADIAPVLRPTNDNLATLKAIRDEPERYLTTNLREVADELVGIQKREEAGDAGLFAATAMAGRINAQADFLGIPRLADRAGYEEFLQGLDVREGVARQKAGQPPARVAHADIGREVAAVDDPRQRKGTAKDVRKREESAAKKSDKAWKTARERVRVVRAELRGREANGKPITNTPLRAARDRVAETERQVVTARRDLKRAEVKAARSSGHAERDVSAAAARERRAAVKEIDEQIRTLETERTKLEGRVEQLRSSEEPVRGVKSGRERRLREMDDRIRAIDSEIKTLRNDRQRRVDITSAVQNAGPTQVLGTAARYRNPSVRRLIAENADVKVAKRKLEEAEAAAKDAASEYRRAALDAPRTTQAMNRRLAEAEAEERRLKTERDLQRERAGVAKTIHNQTAKRPDFPRDYEDVGDWAARTQKAAEDAGLSEPGYWASTPRPTEEASLATIGGGRLTGKVRQRTGALYRGGLETESPEVFRAGIERSIKRRFTWNLVGRNLEAHAFDWSYNDGRGFSIKELRAEMDRRGIDPDTVDMVNTGGAWRELRDAADDDLVGDPDDLDISAPLREITSQRGREDFAMSGQGRFFAVPRDVVDLLQGAATADSAGWRMAELILKQKPARIMLGLANTGWLSFQVMSNALLAGLASKGDILNPRTWVAMQKWWKKMDVDQREQLEMYLGIGHFHQYEQRHLGRTTNGFVNAWRGFKSTSVMRNLHRANPIDLMFKADEKQNNFFRALLFTSKTRRAAARQMNAGWRRMARAQDRLIPGLEGKNAYEVMDALIKDSRTFESHAKAVNDFLGNYVTYSPAERQVFARNVMFYGYLRFSLRFTFWTMPVEHPAMTALLGNLGKLGADEVKRIMGIGEDIPPEIRSELKAMGYEEDDLAAAFRRHKELPAHVLANMWFGGREAAKAGRSQTLPFSRMNPALNQLMSIEQPTQVVGLFSPALQMAVDQAFARSSFTDKAWRISPTPSSTKGQTTPAENQRPRDYYGSVASLLNPKQYAEALRGRGAARNRILIRDILGLAAPYRMWEQAKLKGSQADNSLAWSPRPMAYKDPDTTKSIERSNKIGKEMTSPREDVLRSLLPIAVPKRDVYPDIYAREQEKEADAENRRLGRKKPRRRKKKSGGYRYGGKSSSGYSWSTGG